MIYLITQILLCLFIVGFTGLICGWIARGLRSGEELKAVESYWKRRMIDVQHDRDKLRDEAEQLAGRVRELATAYRSSAENEKQLYKKLEDSDAPKAQEIASRSDVVAAPPMVELQKSLGEVGSFVEELHARNEAIETLDEAISDHTEKVNQLEIDLSETQSAIQSQRANFASDAIDSGEESSDNSGHDDLKLISGIGKKLERTLNDMGISRFKQIANLDAATIEKISNQIGQFSGRIERDQWIEQAKDLLANQQEDQR